MNVKLTSALPKDDKNGLVTIASALIEKYLSKEHTTAIVVLKTAKITQDEEFQMIPETRIVRIEPLGRDLESEALDLLQRATEQRLGKRPDTLDLSAPADEFVDVEQSSALELEATIEDAEIVDNADEPDAAKTNVTPLAPLAPSGGDAA